MLGMMGQVNSPRALWAINRARGCGGGRVQRSCASLWMTIFGEGKRLNQAGRGFSRKTKRPGLGLSRGTFVDQPSPKCCSTTD